ncbi:hypothetical protein ACOMHN_050259 [Nucella lapillus]
MKLSDYQNRQVNVSEDITQNLSSFEQMLCKSLVRVEIIGKRGRLVPILLTREKVDSLNAFLMFRKENGSLESNMFVFAQGQLGSTGHIRGSDTLNKHCKEANLKHPEFVTSTALRKHVATMSQLYNLKDNKLDLVAQYLGHDIRTHRQYYRLPSATLQTAKVAKVLLEMESGHISSSKSIDDIDISDEIVLDEDGDNLAPADDVPDEEDVHDEEREDGCHIVGREEHQAGDGSHSQHPRKGLKQAKTGRRKWSEEEKTACLNQFEQFIFLGNLPGKTVIEKRSAHEPALKKRTWLQIKHFIRNRIEAKKKSM